MTARATRNEILAAADRLFYEKGYEATAFSDIAAAVGISRGNFYYYFRTKDAILAAVIERRLAATEDLLARWEAEGADPAARIRAFIRILVMNRAKILRHGCPVGTLCQELAKLDHPAQGDAARLLALVRDWLARQFAALGRAGDAQALALHLLARSQGAAMIAHALDDGAVLDAEVARMEAWLTAEMPRCS